MSPISSHSMERNTDRPKPAWLIAILFAVAMIFSTGVAADPVKLLFFVSKPTKDYLEVLHTIQQDLDDKFPSKYHAAVQFVSDQTAYDNQIAAANLIVTIGTAAADTAYQYKPNVPIISVLITDSSFASMASKHYGSIDQALANRVSAICIDQPTSRSIDLAKLLLPGAKKLGMMLGPSSTNLQPELTTMISDKGMNSEFVVIAPSDNPIVKIEPVMRESDIFIPVPDNRLINIATAKWILHLSYRHKVPVIAFSRSYLSAGALAAIYSSPENVATQTSEWIADRATSPSGTGGAYQPKYFSIHFNYSVAASLNIPLKTEQFYRERL